MTDINTTPNVDGIEQSAATVGQPVIAPPVVAQPVYVQQAQPIYIVQPPATKKGFGVASMVLGISAVLFSWTAVFAFILLALAFIFGAVSLKKKESPRGFAITGLVLGSVAVLLVILIVVIIAAIAGALGSYGQFGH